MKRCLHTSVRPKQEAEKAHSLPKKAFCSHAKVLQFSTGPPCNFTAGRCGPAAGGAFGRRFPSQGSILFHLFRFSMHLFFESMSIKMLIISPACLIFPRHAGVCFCSPSVRVSMGQPSAFKLDRPNYFHELRRHTPQDHPGKAFLALVWRLLSAARSAPRSLSARGLLGLEFRGGPWEGCSSSSNRGPIGAGGDKPSMTSRRPLRRWGMRHRDGDGGMMVGQECQAMPNHTTHAAGDLIFT